MIVCACILLIAAWASWSGLEVPPDARMAASCFGAAIAALFAACISSAKGTLARRAVRAAKWTIPLAAVAALLGLAMQPLIDRIGPYLSYATAPVLSAPVARLLGLPAASLPGAMVVQDLAEVPAHATSWEQVGLLPAAALALLFALLRAPFPAGWRRAVTACAALLALWLPVRFVLVCVLGDDLGWIGASWSPLFTALTFLPPLWLAARVAPAGPLAKPRWLPSRHVALATVSIAAGAYLVALALEADPAGPARPGRGRVLVDDAHSDWEWTAFPFTKNVYGRKSTYNYSSWVDYLSHFYSVDSNADGELDDALLGRYDVLILKTPTRPYLVSERDAIVRFVDSGGGLLLISDHTNLFGMTTFINPIGEPFGVEFLVDDTFDLTSGSPSYYDSPALGTPAAVAHFPGMRFETSCSLRPRPGLRPIIVGRSLGSEQVDYSHQNFFGNLRPDPDERWGAFLQAAGGRFGRGRVIAFTDSTVFSNFSVFFRGIPELGLGLVEFLARPSRSRIPLVACALAGLVFLALPAALRLSALTRPSAPARASARRHSWKPGTSGRRMVRVVAALAAGSIAGAFAATRVNARSLPLPRPRDPMTVVAFDSAHSVYRLPTLIETSPSDTDRCFDAFYSSLQRMHLFPRVAESVGDALDGARVIVFLNPISVPRPEELGALYEWVRAGGTLLVMESTRGSHLPANGLLSKAGMSITAAFPGLGGPPTAAGLTISGAPSQLLEEPPEGPGEEPEGGAATVAKAANAEPSTPASPRPPGPATPPGLPPKVPAKAPASPSEGVGLPGQRPSGSVTTVRPVVAVAPLGKGRVIALLGSEAFSFQAMGPAFNDPTPSQKRAYERTYGLFETLVVAEGWPETCHLARVLSARPEGTSAVPTGAGEPTGGPGAPLPEGSAGTQDAREATP